MSHRGLHYWMAFFMSLFTAVGGLAVPLLATELGASDMELGIIGSCAAVTYTLMVVWAGTLSDKLGRKRVIIAGSLLTGLSYAVMPACRAPLQLVFLMATCGCGLAAFWPVLEAWLSEEGDAEDIRRGLGGFNISWSIGGAFGPFICGFLYTKSSTLSLLFAAGGTFIVAYLASLHKKPAVYPTHMVEECDDPSNNNSNIIVPRSLLYAVWISNFASWFAISEIRVLFPKLALTIGMQPWVIGALVFCLSIALTGTFYVMGASGRRHTTVMPLVGSQVCVIVLMLGMTQFDSPPVLGFLLVGLGAMFGVTYSYSLYFSVVGSLHKGAASGRHEMALGIGALLGPFAGGAVAQALGTQRAPYVLGAVLVLTALIVETLILTVSRPRLSNN